MNCPHCGSPLPARARTCPACGARVTQSERAPQRTPSSGSAAGAYRAERTPSAYAGRHASAGRHTRAADSYQSTGYASPSSTAHASWRAEHAGGGASTLAAAAKRANASRRRFIAIVVGAAVIAAIAYLIWGSFFRPYSISAKDFSAPGVVSALAAYDSDGDGKLTRDEANAITELDVTAGCSVSGLDKFPNLQTLVVDTDDPGTIDVSQAPQLQTLDLSHAPNVTAVTLSNNANLTVLDASNTGIAELDCAQAPALERLDVASTSVKSLDVSKNSQLAQLECADSVAVSGVENTRMHTYWVVSGLQTDIPPYGGTAGENATVTAAYNENNQLASIDYTSDDDGASSASTHLDFTYDDAGRIAKTAASGSTITNAASTTALSSSALSWNLAYDNQGRISSATSLSGQTYRYTYDGSNRVATCSVSGTGVSANTYTYTYDDAGNLSACVAASGDKTEYTYTGGQLTAAKVTPARDGQATSSYAFTYDDQGRPQTSSYTESTDSTENSLTEKYAYNKNGQLTDASRTSTGSGNAWYYAHHAIVACDYTYDENGNLTGIKAKRENTDDGTYETCALSYTRIFASPDNAPQGSLRPTAYPLDISANPLLWMPWRTIPTPYTLVFAPSASTIAMQAAQQ